jgi:N-acyl-D-aspartate/D-glutamate deacylase
LLQQVDGYDATIVSGVVTRRDGTATGVRPGRLVRGARGAGSRIDAAAS